MIIKTDDKNYFDIAAAIREKNGTAETYKPSEMALAIANIESGGISCTLTISTVPNATVTATFENQTVTAIADVSGAAVLELPKEGVWTVTATYEGETTTKLVDTSFSVTTELSFADPILANNSWEVISAVARAGKAQKYWNVGDTKPITLESLTYNAQIMDFDVYDVSDPVSYGREKAGIVFQCKEVVDLTYSSASAQVNINRWVEEGAECKELIPMIKYPKLASYNATTPTIYEAKGISPSEQEVFGTTTKENIAVGTQYAFYAAGNSKVKANLSGTKRNWWTRSADKSYSTRYVYVNTSGAVASGSSSYYSSPVFCI